MEESNSISKKHHQILKEDQNPSKFYTHFLFKALVVTIFCIILPVFTSQTPEFTNQTRLLELLHFVFVGIAVSYGLFSRKNDENNGSSSHNVNHRLDSANSYVSKILQVSSVFDVCRDNEEDEYSAEPSDEVAGNVQTWKNRYYRNKPEVVLAKDEKPLLLPVRSLKIPNLSSKKFSRSFSSDNAGNGEVRGSSINNHTNSSVDGEYDDVVLPSPIPWRSRSGRMEVDGNTSSSSRGTRIESQSLKPQTTRSTPPNSDSYNQSSMTFPRKSSPLPNLSAESLGKSAEDFVGKKQSFYGAFPPPRPPPPPPPPPPSAFYKSILTKPVTSSSKKNLNRSYTSEPKESDYGIKLEKMSLSKPKVQTGCSSLTIGESVRVVRSDDSVFGGNQDWVFENGFNESSKKSNGFDQETLNSAENQLKSENRSSYLPNKPFKEFLEDENSGFIDQRVMETNDEEIYGDEDDEIDDTGASNLASRILGSSDINEDNEEEEEEEGFGNNSGSDEGPDVDKKADEFIAKFREQIRLQRIESIKRSATAQISRNSSR